jgi:hypothetical protein
VHYCGLKPIFLQRRMLMRGLGSLGVAAAMLVAVVTPQVAQAQHYYYDRGGHAYYYDHGRRYYRCVNNQRQHAVAGTVLGAVAGGLVGSAIGHGRAGGTLLGAGVGAYAGHEIGRSTHPC